MRLWFCLCTQDQMSFSSRKAFPSFLLTSPSGTKAYFPSSHQSSSCFLNSSQIGDLPVFISCSTFKCWTLSLSLSTLALFPSFSPPYHPPSLPPTCTEHQTESISPGQQDRPLWAALDLCPSISVWQLTNEPEPLVNRTHTDTHRFPTHNHKWSASVTSVTNQDMGWPLRFLRHGQIALMSVWPFTLWSNLWPLMVVQIGSETNPWKLHYAVHTKNAHLTTTTHKY